MAHYEIVHLIYYKKETFNNFPLFKIYFFLKFLLNVSIKPSLITSTLEPFSLQRDHFQRHIFWLLYRVECFNRLMRARSISKYKLLLNSCCSKTNIGLCETISKYNIRYAPVTLTTFLTGNWLPLTSTYNIKEDFHCVSGWFNLGR